MKRKRILLGILILVGIVAFLGSAQFGYSQGNPAMQEKIVPCKQCACWKIVSMTAKPNCYKVLPCQEKDFVFSFTVDFQAVPKTLTPCNLVIGSSSKTCQYESSTQPPLDLSGVPVGGSVTFAWPGPGDTVVVTRPNSHHIRLYVPKYYVSCRCDGRTPVTITVTAHSMCGKREMCKADTKTLTVPPCK